MPDFALIRQLAAACARAYREATVNDPRTGTQALVYATGGNIVVAFRGSSEPKDFILDAKFLKTDLMWSNFDSPAEVHTGFLAAFEAVDVEVVKQVRNLIAVMPEAKIFVTGHSLGGALAQLCALEFSRQKLAPAAVVTFGSPRIGNKTFATLYNLSLKSVTFNLVNEGDPVPLLPPLLNGYRDAGTEYFIRKNGAVQVDPFIGCELLVDFMGALGAWKNHSLGLLPNHFIAAYQARIQLL